MVHYEREWASIEYDASLDAMVGQAHEYAEGEPFRSLMNAILDGVEQHDTDCFLADTREMGPIDQADQVWLVEEWSPRAEAAGVRNIAYVVPESVVANMSLDNVVEMVDDDIERQFHENPEPAREWLADA